MSKKNRIFDIVLDEVSLVDKGANQGAHVILMKRDEAFNKQATKREEGEDFPAKAFAYVPDPEKPSTWKLRLWDSIAEKETAAQVGRAVAALGPGFRGQRVQIPSEDLPAVKNKVLAAWLKVNEGKTRADAPAALTKSEAVSFMELMQLKEIREKLFDIVCTFEQASSSILHDDELPAAEKKDKLVESAAQFQAALGQLSKSQKEVNMDKQKELEARNAELEASNADLQKQLDEVKKKLEAFEKSSGHKKSTDPLAKAMESLPENVRKSIEDLQNSNKELSADVQKMREDADKKFWKSKAETISIGKMDDTTELLQKIAKHDVDLADQVYDILAKASAAVEESKSLFDEIGKQGSSDSAYGKLMAKAREMAEKDGITVDQAFSKVYTMDHELRKQYKAERAGK